MWIDPQMGRFLGPLDGVGGWGDRLLIVSEGVPYDFHVDGTFREVIPWRTKALKALSKSHLLRFFEIDFPLPSDAELKEYVGRERIRVLDFSHVPPFQLSTEGPYIKYDSHPTKKVIENWGSLLARALQDG